VRSARRRQIRIAPETRLELLNHVGEIRFPVGSDCASTAHVEHDSNVVPLEYPATWDGSGTACHTEPFGFDKWTNSSGKPCPGERKKFQVRDTILPRAAEIVAAWTTPPPPEDEVTDEDIQRIVAALPPPAPLSKEDVDRIVAGVYARLLRTPSGDKPASTVLEWIKDDTIKTLRAVQDLAVLPSPKAG